MTVNEPESKRLDRLEQYDLCKKRGHVPANGLGHWIVCSHCGVCYKYELVEDPSSLPTNRNVPIEGTNMIHTVPAFPSS